MQRDARDFNILHVCSYEKRAEVTKQTAVPHRILLIWGKRQMSARYANILYIDLQKALQNLCKVPQPAGDTSNSATVEHLFDPRKPVSFWRWQTDANS
jgi:hypothetical protein